MLSTKFKAIAKSQNATYKVNDFKVDGHVGTKLFFSVHNFIFKHKDVEISIRYEIGKSNLAEINFRIPNYAGNKEFKLDTKEHFFRLFSANKKPWKIEGSDKLFTSKINDILRQSGLTKIASETSFEPNIVGSYSHGDYTLITTFSLSFENYEDSVEPIIEFHKQLIDLLL